MAHENWAALKGVRAYPQSYGQTAVIEDGYISDIQTSNTIYTVPAGKTLTLLAVYLGHGASAAAVFKRCHLDIGASPILHLYYGGYGTYELIGKFTTTMSLGNGIQIPAGTVITLQADAAGVYWRGGIVGFIEDA